MEPLREENIPAKAQSGTALQKAFFAPLRLCGRDLSQGGGFNLNLGG
jgi:hypothetical protein